MKKKILIPLVLSFMLISKLPVLASETKNAVLSTASIRIEGGENITIQSYNVDGYNYIRARELTNLLNMDILGLDDGVMIKPTVKAESVESLEEIKETNAKVNMKQGLIYYTGYSFIETDYFNLNDRNYFKLADMAESVKAHEENMIEFTKFFNKVPYEDKFPMFSINWNESQKTVEISLSELDLNKVFNDFVSEPKNNNPTSNTQNNITNTEDSTVQNTSSHTILPEYKSVDEIPKFPAKIFKVEPTDPTVPTNDRNNLTEAFYTGGTLGECGWYTMGRFREIYGFIYDTHGKNSMLNSSKREWINLAKSDKFPNVDGIPYLGNGDLSNMPNRGVAVWEGHTIFIEFVERDSNGYPKTIYYTEANAGSATQYKGYILPSRDGMRKSVVNYNFTPMSGDNKFVGFIVYKDNN